MNLSTGDWLSLLDDFSQEVKWGNYKKTDYKVWRTISRWSGAILWENGDEIIVEETDDILRIKDDFPLNVESFSINDESFGAYLYNRVCKPLFNADEMINDKYKYKNIINDKEISYLDKKIPWKTDPFEDLDTSYGAPIKGTVTGDTYTVSTADTVPINYIDSCVIKGSAVADSVSIKLDEFATKEALQEAVENIKSLEAELARKADIEMIKDKKENERMNMFKNFEFGKVNGDSVRMSMYGLAIRNQSGVWVSYNTATNEIVDVDVLNFNGEQFMYKMPVALAQVAKGDVIIHQRKPVFVNEVCEDGKMVVIDVFDGEEKMILPTKSPFGFNFATRVVSLMDFMNGNQATADNPFGNMAFMLAMSGENKMEDLLPMMMMTNGGMDMKNPMSMMMLMTMMDKDNKATSMSDMMMMAMLSGAFTPTAKAILTN